MERPSSLYVDEKAMNAASHIRFGFECPVIRLFLLTTVGILSFAQVPAVADPNQAVLLDGATDASSVFYVAFTSNGLQFSIQIPPDPCPDTEHVPQAGVFQGSIQAIGTYQSDQFDSREFIGWPTFTPRTLPPNLQGLWDDCDVVENFSDVATYMDQAYFEATDLTDDIDVCVQDARAAHCHLVEVIENAEFVLTIDLPFVPPPVSGGDSPIVPQECVEFLLMLETTPQILDSMEYDGARCEMFVSLMSNWAAKILAEGQIRDYREDALAAADSLMSGAEEQKTLANEKLNQISQMRAQLLLPDVEESCEVCSDSPREGPLIPLSGAVILQTGRAPLDRYVTAFYQAASYTDDPDLAARLSDIAFRLEEIPDGRVHHLTFTSASVIEQDFLALHPVDAPDDGESPLAVLLTAVNPSPPLPPMNASDERLLFDGYEAFLTRVGGTTQGIPAVSVWGLVVMALLVLTAGTVVCARRGPAQT